MQTTIDNKTTTAQRLRDLDAEFEAFEAEGNQAPKLSLVHKAKQAFKALVSGHILNGEQSTMLTNFTERKMAVHYYGWRARQYDALMTKYTELGRDLSASRPYVPSGPGGIDTDNLLRVGVPMELINGGHHIGEDYGRELRGEPDDPPVVEPERLPIVDQCRNCHASLTKRRQRGGYCPYCMKPF